MFFPFFSQPHNDSRSCFDWKLILDLGNSSCHSSHHKVQSVVWCNQTLQNVCWSEWTLWWGCSARCCFRGQEWTFLSQSRSQHEGEVLKCSEQMETATECLANDKLKNLRELEEKWKNTWDVIQRNLSSFSWRGLSQQPLSSDSNLNIGWICKISDFVQCKSFLTSSASVFKLFSFCSICTWQLGVVKGIAWVLLIHSQCVFYSRGQSAVYCRGESGIQTWRLNKQNKVQWNHNPVWLSCRNGCCWNTFTKKKHIKTVNIVKLGAAASFCYKLQMTL